MNWQRSFWSVLVLMIVSNIVFMYILRDNALKFAAIMKDSETRLQEIQEMCKKK